MFTTLSRSNLSQKLVCKAFQHNNIQEKKRDIIKNTAYFLLPFHL